MIRRLGDILIQQGVINEEKLMAALSDQRAFGGKLGRTLVDLDYVTEDELVHAVATQLDLDKVDLDRVDILDDALRCLPVDACERYGVFPVRVDLREQVLWVATAEPDRQTLQEVARISQLTVEPMVSSMSAIDRAVRRYYFGEKHGPKPRAGEPITSIPGAIPLASPAPRVVPHVPEDAAVLPQAVVESLGHVAPEGGSSDGLEELKTLIIRLEKSVTAQSRAFRALVDILQEKGVVRRGELGARTAKK